MKFFIFSLILITSIQSQALFRRGPISSGGGSGVYCLNELAEESVELLDYYETKQLYDNEHILKGTGDWVKDLYALTKNAYKLQGLEDFDKLIETFDVVKHNLDFLLKKTVWLEESLDLNFDMGETIELPNYCERVQIAMFDDSTQVLKIYKPLWDELDSLNKAILIAHELYYIFERKEDERNSETTRSYIRQILTATIQIPVRTGLEDAKLVCESEKLNELKQPAFSFFVREKRGESFLNFINFDHRSLLVQTQAEVDLMFNPETNLPNDYEKMFKLGTMHTNKWSLKIKVEPNKNIYFQAYSQGSPLGQMEKVSCKAP